APAARTLLTAIADDGVPVAVSLVLIVGGDLEREGFVMFERGAAVEADTRDAGNREFDHNDLPMITHPDAAPTMLQQGLTLLADEVAKNGATLELPKITLEEGRF